MAKGYRNQVLPGIKKCIDYMKGKTVKEEKPEIKDVPPQVYKQNK
jgi:hypothetical protein